MTFLDSVPEELVEIRCPKCNRRLSDRWCDKCQIHLKVYARENYE